MKKKYEKIKFELILTYSNILLTSGVGDYVVFDIYDDFDDDGWTHFQ